jgi:hypothetical protein
VFTGVNKGWFDCQAIRLARGGSPELVMNSLTSIYSTFNMSSPFYTTTYHIDIYYSMPTIVATYTTAAHMST